MGGKRAKKEHLLTTLHALVKAEENKDKALRNLIVLCFPGVVHSTYKHVCGGGMHVYMCLGETVLLGLTVYSQ